MPYLAIDSVESCPHKLTPKQKKDLNAGKTVTIAIHGSLSDDEYDSGDRIDIFLKVPLQIGKTYRRKNLELGGYKDSFYEVVHIHKGIAMVECVKAPNSYGTGEIDLFRADTGTRHNDGRLGYRLKNI